jgi:hypothetical protein
METYTTAWLVATSGVQSRLATRAAETMVNWHILTPVHSMTDVSIQRIAVYLLHPYHDRITFAFPLPSASIPPQARSFLEPSAYAKQPNEKHSRTLPIVRMEATHCQRKAMSRAQ